MTEQETVSVTESKEPDYHSMELDRVLQSLSANVQSGLSENEAESRLEQYGPNEIPKVKGSFWKVYLAPILNWLINIYIISSIALLIIPFVVPTGENQIGQALVWLAVVAVNCFVAIFQQFRAQKKLEALEKLSAGEARVRRNGNETNLEPTEIVPGDIIKLEQGDKIPADGRIVTCSNLTTDEASLTGESVPVTKNVNAEVSEDAPLTDMKNMVFFGTYVATGNAIVVVTKTGGKTEIGKIQGTLEQLNTGDIPLRKKVNLLAKFLGIAAIFLMFVSVAWQLFISPILMGDPLDFGVSTIADRITAGITRAMTIMPINIPLLTTIVLLTGVLAMAKEGVIIRDLSAVESLGRVSVICSDKTGTMTKNQMTVKFVWDTENLYSVTGDGYNPEGDIYRVRDEESSVDSMLPENEVQVTDALGWKGLYWLILSGGINNDSEVVSKELPDQGTVWVPLGDPTDAAILTLFRKSSITISEGKNEFKIIKEYPFDSELKRMSKLCSDGENTYVFSKGATEVLLPMCVKINGHEDGRQLTSEEIENIEEMTTKFALKGYRVISFAMKKIGGTPPVDLERNQAEEGLTYMGMVCIVDPPRLGVREAVDACHSAGINVIMITGDSSATAKTIAEALNIVGPDSIVVEGGDADDLSDDEFARVNVFARVNPEHKQTIVERYQNQRKVVAMTGDGVNDALALAMSDAGIAMGITGTDVAKEAADLVITDDSFPSIVKGVHQGRGLFNKIRMMIYFYIAINLFESIIFFGALIILPAYIDMLSVWQSLYLVVTTHSFPGLALVFDKTSPHAMEEKPRDSEEIITRPIANYMALNVVLMAIGAAFVYALTFTGWLGIVTVYPENLVGYYPNFEPFPLGMTLEASKATVMLLTMILIVESTVVLIIRRINMPVTKSLKEPGISRYVVLLGLIYLAHLLLMYVPEVQALLAPVGLHFYFMPLTLYDWGICILFSLPAIIGMEIYKRYLRNKGESL